MASALAVLFFLHLVERFGVQSLQSLHSICYFLVFLGMRKNLGLKSQPLNIYIHLLPFWMPTSRPRACATMVTELELEVNLNLLATSQMARQYPDMKGTQGRVVSSCVVVFIHSFLSPMMHQHDQNR